MKGRKKKGVINLSAIDEKTSGGATKTATEKNLEKVLARRDFNVGTAMEMVI